MVAVPNLASEARTATLCADASARAGCMVAAVSVIAME